MRVERPFPPRFSVLPMRPMRGFTLTELIAVLVIAGILAVTAMAALNPHNFDTARFADQTLAQLEYAQKVAIATRRAVTVTIASNTISLTMCIDAACSSSVPVPSPQGEASFSRTAPTGVAVAAPTFGFTALGDVAGGANITLTITGDITRSLTVEATTGYVHP